MKKPILLCSFFLGLIPSLFSQSGPNDSTFNVSDGIYGDATGFNGGVNSLVIQPDGKILAGGTFTAYNGIAEVNQIARIHPNGYIDSSFSTGTGFNNVIFSIALQSDGKIVAGGNFNSFNGIAGINKIIRLNADGSIDSSFNTGTGFDQGVSCVAIQPDGKIVVGGHFNQFNGSGISRIARLNADGSIDSSFHTGNGFNSSVSAFEIQPDGKIIVGGGFTVFDTIPGINRIARLNTDGTLDTSFHTGTGFNSNIYSLIIQADGKVVVSGQFTSYDGANGINRIARLNTGGTLDQSFNTGSGFDGGPLSFAIQSDGKIVAGGGFTSYNGVTSINNLLRLNMDGTMDLSFNTGNGFDGSTDAIAIQTDGKMIIGGVNSTAFGIEDIFLRLNTNGTMDPTFNVQTGSNSLVRAIVIQPDGKIIVGGNFTSFNGNAGIGEIVRLHTDGTTDTTFQTGSGFNHIVYALVLQPDGKILVGGQFTSYNGIPGINYMARLNPDGTIDTSFQPGTGFGGGVRSVLLQPDGKIIAGGDFVSFNGDMSIKRIIRLNADGTIDPSFNTGSGFNNGVIAMVLQPDGKIIVGGAFTSFNATTGINHIIRLNTNGTPDVSFVTGTGFNQSVYTLALQPDGKIIAGGSFTSFNSATGAKYIACLNTDGTIEPTFNYGTGFNDGLMSLLIQPDGKIIAGGYFSSFSGNPRNRIIRLHPTGFMDPSFTIGTGFDDFVISLALQPDGKILVGGNFNHYNGVWRNRITRLLNYNNVATSVDTQVHCGPFTWINGVTYTSSNTTATYTLPNASANGNDSIISLNLTITNINNAVSLNGITLTATNQTGATYQWIDCATNTPVTGATARVFNPTANGNYAVKITLNGCSETSDCIAVTTVGLEYLQQNELKIYPNPARENLVIEVPEGTKIQFTDISGKVIQTEQLTPGSNSIDLSKLTAGVYFIASNFGTVLTLVKQ